MKQKIKRVWLTLAAVTVFVAAPLSVNAATSDPVYDRSDYVFGFDAFADTFTIETAGLYQATLTDYAFPNEFDEIGLLVTDGPQTFGRLDAPGSFTFNATPGDYNLFFYGAIDNDTFASFSNRYRVSTMGSYNIQIAMIPELETWLMMGLGGIAVFYWARRKQRNRQNELIPMREQFA